jgi:type II restriction enzyme
MFKYDEITPFICFGHGCDFSPSSKTVLMKLAAMNEFYEINKIYIKKADRNSAGDAFQPVSMFFREKEWSEEEMFDKMTKIAEVTLQHYLLKLAF